ncbi:MAG: cupin domain-containing protein [Candidatus Thermoplasmatota archaeon]|nr:cupin domain-containing protein [Candidatus Thermoplasmatota archaeon]
MDPIRWENIKEIETRPGVFRRVFTAGSLQVIRYRYAPGSVFEDHSHTEEQLTIGIEGELKFTIGGSTSTFGSGDLVHIPGGAHHSATNRSGSDAVTLNVYTPPKRGLMNG